MKVISVYLLIWLAVAQIVASEIGVQPWVNLAIQSSAMTVFTALCIFLIIQEWRD